MRKLLTALAVSTLLASAACSSGDDDPPQGATATTRATDTTGSPEATDDTDDTDTDTDTTETTDDTSAGEDAADSRVLGSATARLPADPDDPTLVPLRLDVVSLERSAGLVEVRLLLSNEGEGDAPAWEPFRTFDDARLPDGQGDYSLSGAALVDGDAQQAYLAVIDSEGACLCTDGLDGLAVPPGESVELYADFGGVPDDVELLDVQVPGFPMVTQVAIGS